MKRYLKILLVALILNTIILFGVFKYFEEHYSVKENFVDASILVDESVMDDSFVLDKGARVNFLIYGKDGGRSDTIMVLGYDLKSKAVDIISVPRDTLYRTSGKTGPGQNKINAVVGFSDGNGPIDLKRAVSSILNIPIAYYIELDYKGAAEVVDSVGGVEIDVPFRMKYDDVYARPQLHIDLKKGRRLLNGKDAVDYLRWRKNNGQGGEGDIPRTKRQQQFVKALMKKAISINFPSFINSASKNIKTDLAMDKIAYIATQAATFNMKNLHLHTLPGRLGPPETGLYIHDQEKTRKMMEKIYRLSLKSED